MSTPEAPAPETPYPTPMSEARTFEGPPWQKQAWESDIAFEAFRKFRNSGYRRTIVGTAKKMQRSDSLLFRWSQLYRWRERASLYDEELDLLQQAKHRRATAKMTENHADLAKILFNRVAQRMKTLKVDELEPKDLVKWLEVSVKIERISRNADAQHRSRIAPVPRKPSA